MTRQLELTSLAGSFPQVRQAIDPAGAWPIVASGEATWDDAIGEWDRPNEQDYAGADIAADALVARWEASS